MTVLAKDIRAGQRFIARGAPLHVTAVEKLHDGRIRVSYEWEYASRNPTIEVTQSDREWSMDLDTYVIRELTL